MGGRRAPLQEGDQRIEQGRDMVGKCAIGLGPMERLLTCGDEPALQDLVAACMERRRNRAQLSLAGERLHPSVDLRVHSMLLCAASDISHDRSEPGITALSVGSGFSRRPSELAGG